MKAAPGGGGAQHVGHEGRGRRPREIVAEKHQRAGARPNDIHGNVRPLEHGRIGIGQGLPAGIVGRVIGRRELFHLRRRGNDVSVLAGKVQLSGGDAIAVRKGFGISDGGLDRRWLLSGGGWAMSLPAGSRCRLGCPGPETEREREGHDGNGLSSMEQVPANHANDLRWQ